MEVYEPQEDSILLQESVTEHATGAVLDMGTGSGIQGKTALQCESVDSVTFVDIDADALAYAKKHTTSTKNVRFVHSDLFKNVKGRFDTIIFNPPYLPDDAFDDAKNITTGGKEGHELLERFLKDAKHHLTPLGKILIVFSSLTNKDKINEILKSEGYTYMELKRTHVFMEDLYVYSIQQQTHVFKGHRGIVTIEQSGRKKVAIKRGIHAYNATKEAKFLQILNKKKIGPKLYAYTEDTITMEYVDGERILDYFKHATKKQMIEVIAEVLVQTMMMDGLGINKLELTNPYKHVIITPVSKITKKPRVIMIDFERCYYTEKPKNTTQFIQFLASGKMQYVYKSKGIRVAPQKLLELARAYKSKDQNKTKKRTNSRINKKGFLKMVLEEFQ